MAVSGSLIIERGRLRHVAGLLGIVPLAIWGFLTATEWEDFVVSLSYSAAGVVSGHVLMRLYMLWEEVPLFHRTCGGALQNLFNRLMPNGSSIASLLALIVAALGICNEVVLDPAQSKKAIPFFFCTCTCTFMSLIVRAEECSIWQDHTMSHLNGLDYGSGMAQSFFYGYLKLVLPAKGIQNKNLTERITAFMETSRLEEPFFPVKKLIVLIPSSGHSYPTLRDVPSQAGELEPAIIPLESKDVEAHVQDRAGTKGRVYKVGSYRIRVEHEKKTKFLYALVEGATPLLTFKEACQTSEYLRKHKVDIVSNFYKTLDNLIKNDHECAHLVELKAYDDEGEEPDVVNILQDYLLSQCDKSRVFA